MIGSETWEENVHSMRGSAIVDLVFVMLLATVVSRTGPWLHQGSMMETNMQGRRCQILVRIAPVDCPILILESTTDSPVCVYILTLDSDFADVRPFADSIRYRIKQRFSQPHKEHADFQG